MKRISTILLLLSGSAFEAVSSDELQSSTLDEVITTARYRAESLGKIPASVESLSYEIKEFVLSDIEDVLPAVPNAHITETGLSTQVRIRGVGSGNSQGFEQSVGTYVDGVVYGRSQMLRTPIFDTERFEVHRGPQGTFFGKNSMAGAIGIYNNQPTSGFGGGFSLYHDFDEDGDIVIGHLTGELVDSLNGRLAFRSNKSEGFMENTQKGQIAPSRDEKAIRSILNWKPVNYFETSLKVELNEYGREGRSFEITQDLPSQGVSFSTFLQSIGAGPIEPVFDYNTQYDADDYSENKLRNFTLDSTFHLDLFDITIINGFVDFESEEFCECDYLPVDIVHLLLEEDYSQTSHEIRFTSNEEDNDIFSWVLGLYHQEYDHGFRDVAPDTDNNLLAVLINPAFAGTTSNRVFSQDSRLNSIFGSLTINLTKQFSIDIGGRYSKEHKTGEKSIDIIDTSSGIGVDPLTAWVWYSALGIESNQLQFAFNVPDPNSTQNNPLPNLQVVPLVNSGHSVISSRDEESFTPSLSLNFNLSESTFLYALYSEGYKAGGFDPRSNILGERAVPAYVGAAPSSNKNFEFSEETATTYEIGMKNEFLDGKLATSLSVFSSTFDDLQASQFDGAVGFNIDNIPKTTAKGLEFSGRYKPTMNTLLSFSYGYLDFNYDEFETGNCNEVNRFSPVEGRVDFDGDGDYELCSYSGRRGIYTPKHSANVSINYYDSFFNGYAFNTLIGVSYRSDYQTHVNLDPNGVQDGFALLSAAFSIEKNGWMVSVVGNNLTDENTIAHSGNVPLSSAIAGSNTFYSYVNPGRSVSLGLGYSF